MDDGAEQQHVALADEPLGAGLVEDDPAVGEAGHGERERAGMLALMTPVMTFDARPLGGDDEVDADGAGLLGDAADRLLDVAGRHHHQVVQLVDHDHDERQALVRAVAARLGLEVAAVEGGVVAGDVAEADLGQQVVAALHLLAPPTTGRWPPSSGW